MVQFSCECGRQLQARDEDAGKQAKCPACGRVSPIPRSDAITAEDDEAPVRRADPARPDAVRKDRDDDRDSDRDRDPDRERDRDRDDDDRPRRRKRRSEEPEGTSGKATAAIILGLMSFPCVGNVFTGLPAILFGALALRDIGKSDGRLGGKGMAITGLITGCMGILVMVPAILIALLLPAVQKVREAATRMQESNNLKQLSLSMQNFHTVYGALPQAAAFRSPKGKPLLSWRVAMLPYIEQNNLYMQFKLDEPWDSPHNIKLLPMIPKIYLEPGEVSDGSGMTRYQVFVGPGTVFEEPTTKPGEKPGPGQLPLFLGPGVPMRGHTFNGITDGLSNTILIAMAGKPVPWTKPEDMPFDPKGSLPQFSKRFSAGFNAAMVDGSVRVISHRISDQTLRNAIMRNDGNVLGPDW